MKTLQKLLTVAAVIGLMVWRQFAYAGWEYGICSTPARGSDIAVNASVPIFDVADPYVGITVPLGWVSDRYIDVRLRHDESVKDYFGYDWKLTVTYTIKFYDINDNYLSQVIGEKITIDYSGTTGESKDRAINRYSNMVKGEVYVTDVAFSINNGTPTSLSAYDLESLLFDMEYGVERYRKLSSYLPPIANGTPVNNEVQINWETIVGAESYDLEWMYVDIPPNDNIGTPVEFDWRDATRINTKETSYKVKLVYPRGVFVYRVRGIGMGYNTDQAKLIREYGNWTRSNNSYMDETQDDDFFEWDGFEPLINWTSSIDYAEEGKKKEIVSFYDGSGRIRQTVTTLNSDNNAIVAETYYDHAGRAAVNTLPVPVKNGSIKYYIDFNDGFGRDNFDEQDQLAVAGPDPMSTGGTVEYYSQDNPFLGDSYQISHIPDAEGYPFVQTRVLNDGTGRPHSTSGVGPTHKLQSGHETKYFYGAPSGQEEIDRLFGNEAGFVANYKKNMVLDANGQVSVTYLDGYGRTVATALAGENPSNLHEISAPAAESFSVSLLASNTVTDNISTTTRDFLVSTPGTYTFSYSLDPQEFDIPCWENNDEKPCKYDLSIRIYHEVDGELVEVGAGIELTQIEEAVNETLSVSLTDIGKYVVVKDLKVSPAVADGYASDLQDYLQPDPYAIPDPLPSCFQFSPMETPCLDCEESCTESYTTQLSLGGTLNTVVTIYRNPDGELFFPPSDGYTNYLVSQANPNVQLDEDASESLQEDLETCISRCESTAVPSVNVDECQVMADVMVADMEPGGQYFNNKRSLDILEASVDVSTYDAYHALYTDDDITSAESRYFWINTFIPDALQQTLATMAGITWADDDYEFWAELEGLWASKIKPHANYQAIRDDLLSLHPEYCTHYYFCVMASADCCSNVEVSNGEKWGIACSEESPSTLTNTETSQTYDVQFNALNDFDDALDGNWFNPLNIPDMYTSGLSSSSNPVNQDPFFCPNGWAGQNGFSDIMLNRLMRYYPTPGDSTIKMSIYEVLTWDPLTYTAPTSPPAYHDEILAFLIYLHGDGSTVEGILDDNMDIPTLVSGEVRMSRWQFFKQTYYGIKKQVMKLGYTTWAKENCVENYGNFPLAATECGASNPTGDLECANDCYLVSRDVNGDLETDGGTFSPNGEDFDGFDARYQFYCLPQSVEEFADDFCEKLADGYAYQWLSQMENPYIGCVSADATLSDFLADPAHAGIREELLAYLKAYFIYACEEETATPPTGSSPADFEFTPLSAPVALSTLFPTPQFGWDVPSGLTTISSPGDILLIFKEEFENQHGLEFHCPDELFTPSMGIPSTLIPGEAPETVDINEIACPCAKFAEWVMNTEDAFDTGLNPEIFNPIRFEAFGETDLSFLNMTAISAALEELETGLSSSFDVSLFVEYCRNPQTYGETDINGFDPESIPEVFSCSISTPLGTLECEELNAISDGANNLNAYRDSVRHFTEGFVDGYVSTCMQAIVSREDFSMAYTLNEYHYTLYYYDQAGNLIKTVPPAGVKVLNAAERAESMAHRNQNHAAADYAYDNNGTPNGSFTWPEHRLVTNYRYNSSNQPIYQHTPDGGDSRFWYDKLGRMVLSQNAKQAVPVGGKVSYSYTLYDELGRIKEVGQLENKPAGIVPDDELTSNPVALESFIGTGSNRKQVTRTYYDTPASMVIPGFAQKNVRNRVSRTEFLENGGSATNFITYYSYDIHGNVNELVHQVAALQSFDRKFIRTSYEYDLVSGNVNKVIYQAGKPEMFIHKYDYDADNRLTEVHTSRDNVLWDLDAKYFYYPHGPLARMEIGEKQVQGVDYAYTLHGWLKAVNGIRLAGDNPYFDMGHDGVQSVGELHTAFARDAFAFSLFYYGETGSGEKKDYTAIDDINVDVDRNMGSVLNSSSGVLGRGLFNGNIASMTTSLRKTDESLADALRKTYQYDQLNRIVQSNSYFADADSDDDFGTVDNRYYTHYGYDANGNITDLERKDGTGNLLDDLTYDYSHDGSGFLTSNRLNKIGDSVSDSYSNKDVDDQASATNYTYDPIGNLISDEAEQIQAIKWNVYGKVKEVIRESGSGKPNLEFFYDPSGQRYAKVEKPAAGSAPQAEWKYTFYLRDAQGNPLCIYEAEKGSNPSYTLQASERPIYGSSRIGLDAMPVKVGNSLGVPTFTVSLTPPKYHDFYTHAILGPGTLNMGENIQVRTNEYDNAYTPEDFMYYRNEGLAEVTFEKPAFKNFVFDGEVDVQLFKNGTPHDWEGVRINVHDGEWYILGGELADTVFSPSGTPYDIDSVVALGGAINLGQLTLYNDAGNVYGIALGGTGYINQLESPMPFPFMSSITDGHEFVLSVQEADTLFAEDGTVRMRSSVFYTTDMRADEFAEQLPYNVGYSFDESVLALPGGQQIFDVFNAEIYQRDDSLENTYTNSTIRTYNLEFKYWSATEIDSVGSGILFAQKVDSLQLTGFYEDFWADSFQVERNDTLFTGYATTKLITAGYKHFTATGVSIPGFGAFDGSLYTVNWLDLSMSSSSDDSGSVRLNTGTLQLDMSGLYNFVMAGNTENVSGTFHVLKSSEVLVGNRFYTGVEGDMEIADSISVWATGATLAVDNIYFDPVIARAGISCGKADSIAAALGYATPLTDTLYLPFAATWRTETGVYFRKPFIYSDSDGCYIESRDAVRLYGNLNIINLPYAHEGEGLTNMMAFDGIPSSRVQVSASGLSGTQALASIVAVDSLGNVVYEAYHSEVSSESGSLYFTGSPVNANYVYLGAAPEDTVFIDGRAAFLTNAFFRMGIGTLSFESPDTLYGVYMVDDVEVSTAYSSFTVQGGMLMAMGTHWVLKGGNYEDFSLSGMPLKQVTAYRPRTAGVAERIITDSQYAEPEFFDNGPDQSGWNLNFTLPIELIPCHCNRGGVRVKGYTFVVGRKIYELSNHLGNVLSTISDRKIQASGTGGVVDYYLPDVRTMTDYYPFGMAMDGRTETQAGTEAYRFGFNGQEKVDEVSGEGNSYTAEFWQYDPRIGRRWNLDPKPQVFISDYAVMGNNPILYLDPKGDKFIVDKDEQSREDIRSTVKKKYRDLIDFNDETGETKINVDLMKGDEKFNKKGEFNEKKYNRFIKNAMKDDGIDVINTLSNATKKDGDKEVDEVYFYSSTLNVRVITPEGKRLYRTYNPGEKLAKDGIQVNLSTMPHTKGKTSDLPPVGYDGYVVLPRGTAYLNNSYNTTFEVKRGQIVLHELDEIYRRTHFREYWDEAHPKSRGAREISFFIVGE